MTHPEFKGDLLALLQAFPTVGALWHLPHWIDRADGDADTLYNRFVCLLTHSHPLYIATPRRVWEKTIEVCGETFTLAQIETTAGKRVGVVAVEEFPRDDQNSPPVVGVEEWGREPTDGRIWYRPSANVKAIALPREQWFFLFQSDPEEKSYGNDFRAFVIMAV